MGKISKKILGKYEIIKELGQDRYRARYANKEFEISQIYRNEDNERFSFTASKLSNLSHRNLKTIQVEEDEGYFYFIKECLSGLETLDSEVFIDGNEVDYKKLFECYLQLWEALHYIDKEGYYHGNINPSNILINTQDSENYEAFLLDFGRSYYYREFDTEQGGLRFYAPEQLGSMDSKVISESAFLESTPDIRSDIYAFGLCMLKLLLDSFEDCSELDSYKEPKDLEGILEKVRDEWELEDIEKDIFLLVKKCCHIEPEKRITLSDLKDEILNIYDKAVPKNTYELKCESDKTLEKYAENNDLDSSDLESIMKHIQMRIDEHTAFIRQVEEKNKKSKELESKLEIAINNLIFVCSAAKNTDSYLWVWQVRENELTRIEKIKDEGLELRHKFVFTTKGWKATNRDTSSVITLKNELDYRFQRKKLEIEQGKIDTKAIASEERLLEAEKKDIDSKKKTHFARLDEIKKGADTLIFTLIKKVHKDDSDELESETLNEAIRDKDNTESSGVDSKTKSKQDEFKPKEEVVIQEKCNMGSLKQEDSFKGEVVSYKPDSKQITIKLKEKYGTLFDEKSEKELKKKEWAISYDYQVREILWSKRNTALEELKKGNTQIPNLLRKINEPKELRENAQIELDGYFNENLDENQQEAVRKALSLESDCEILLIQGPPGTGKTTTITEILKQYQKRHRHYKILITSQSNQAVDNVLEKICASKVNPAGEDKIFRIGNDKSKMSEIAKQYTEEEVLDKILKENKKRIKKQLESKITTTATAEVSLRKNRGFQSGDEVSLLDINERADTAESTILTKETTQIESKLQALQKGFLEKLETLSSKAGSVSDNSKKGKRDLETFTLFTKDIRLFFGTLLGISSWKNFRDVVFDVAIVDEAGRATLSELLVPCIKAKRMILVGDHKQLAPVVDDDVIEKLNVDSKQGKEFKATKKDVTTSLFERLFERIERDRDECEYLYNFRHTLTYNYRAHTSICDLYSRAFYEGILKTKPEVSALKEHKLKAFGANAVWLDTGKRSDKIDGKKGTGKINHCNATIIYSTLEILKKQILESEAITNIGIITPYKAQAELLKSKLKKEIESYKDSNISIDIGTVDSFQGSDRDMIIHDCVRSSAMKNTQQTQKKRQGSKIDFIADGKRLNVSLSRAKKLLLIVGDREYLRTASVSEGENPFSAIIKEFDNTQKYQVIELTDSKDSKQ